MNGESTSLFKVFRVLWFPMSVNALALGAAATLIFILGTWGICAITGGFELGYAKGASLAFFPASRDLALRGDWPEMLEVSRWRDAGRTWHEVRRTTGLFSDWVGPYLIELPARDDPPATSGAPSERVIRALGRYGWVYGFQLVLFFALLATFGVAICRIIALRIARDEYSRISDAWRYAWKVKLTGLLFPIAVLLPLAFLALCNFVAGTISQIPYVGWLLSVLFLPLVLVSTVLIVLALIASLISVGLMPAAIAVERKGTYDSLGKSWNYIFARPLPLLLHLALIALFIGIIYEIFVDNRMVERVAVATLAPFFGEDYRVIAAGRTDLTRGFAEFCALLHKIIYTIFQLLVWGALVSYTLGAFTSLFLILRKDVDGLDFTDVARDQPDMAAPPAPAAPEAPAPMSV